MKLTMHKTPQIYSAISIVFEEKIDIDAVIKDLNSIGINKVTIRKPKLEPTVCLDIAIVKKEPFWEINDALSKMFKNVDSCLDVLIEIIKRHQGNCWIDISFYQYGTFPSLVFSGDNMKKIHCLNANISIDPY